MDLLYLEAFPCRCHPDKHPPHHRELRAATVGAAHSAPDDDIIAVSQHVINNDLHVRKRAEKLGENAADSFTPYSPAMVPSVLRIVLGRYNDIAAIQVLMVLRDHRAISFCRHRGHLPAPPPETTAVEVPKMVSARVLLGVYLGQYPFLNWTRRTPRDDPRSATSAE